MKFSQLPFHIRLMTWLMILCFVTSILLFSYGFMLMHERTQKVAMVKASVNSALTVIRAFERRTSHHLPDSTEIGNGYGFLKVHKAASTSAQEVFLRYGWRRNMTFVLPPENNTFGYPNIISTYESLTKFNILPPPIGKKFEILCHHVFYNRTAWDQTLPVHAAKIGSIREPLAVFQSVLQYFKPQSIKSIQSKNPVRTFLQNPNHYDNRDIRWSFLNNRMALEYGVDVDVINKRDFARFENYLYEVLDKDFIVVVVAEMFDQSLVLVKRILNWTLNDILYIPKNQRTRLIKNKSNTLADSGEEIRNLHKRFAAFDYILYDFFKKKLAVQIAKEARFSEEVEQFKSIRKQVYDYCYSRGVVDIFLYKFHELGDHVNTTRILIVAASEWNAEFEFTAEDCYIMYADEISMTQEIRRRQYGKVTWFW